MIATYEVCCLIQCREAFLHLSIVLENLTHLHFNTGKHCPLFTNCEILNVIHSMCVFLQNKMLFHRTCRTKQLISPCKSAQLLLNIE